MEKRKGNSTSYGSTQKEETTANQKHGSTKAREA
jgi:hypothetical protein